jgi:hypothetical protein
MEYITPFTDYFGVTATWRNEKKTTTLDTNDFVVVTVRGSGSQSVTPIVKKLQRKEKKVKRIFTQEEAEIARLPLDKAVNMEDIIIAREELEEEHLKEQREKAARSPKGIKINTDANQIKVF